MNRLLNYSQLLLGVILFLLGLYFYGEQANFYQTTWRALAGYVFWISGILIIYYAGKKTIFPRISIYLENIYKWRGGKYENLLVYITVVLFLFLFVGLAVVMALIT